MQVRPHGCRKTLPHAPLHTTESLLRKMRKLTLLRHFAMGTTNKSTSVFESGPAQYAYLTTRRFVGKDSRGGTFLILLDLCGMMHAGSFFPCLVTFLYHIDAGISRIDAFSRDQYSTLVISQRLFSITIFLPFNTYANYLGKLFFFYMLGPTDDVGGLYLYR